MAKRAIGSFTMVSGTLFIVDTFGSVCLTADSMYRHKNA